ncbi:MAG: hypothetical protein MJA29_06355 [Candidatus Omnitrophica bacterium]|nr:hypothetical protein [Candidatus Omnitrophota bacterium]
MSADPIVYCLEHVSDYRDFERLCSAFLICVGYSDIDPLGGTGDEGRDAIVKADEAGRKIVFAYTVRSDWRVKLASDSKRIHDMGHDPNVLVFVCTEALSASDKDYAHKFIAEKYGWTLELFDLERLRVQLIGPQRHLIAQHPSIFAPPFFSQKGGQSISESRDTLLIDHVSSDHALATWLARRLSIAGYRTWCYGTAPLAGENADETVRKLLDVRAIHYLPVVSPSSMQDDMFLERCTIATTKEDFVLPCSAGNKSNVRIPSRLGKLEPADFKNSWIIGLDQVIARLKTLGVKPPFDHERGRKIALRDYLPTRVTVAKPEPIFANVFSLHLPKSMNVFQLRRPLTEIETHELRKHWAFANLNAYHLVSFEHPPQHAISAEKVDHIAEFSWVDIPYRDGKKTLDLAKELAKFSLQVVCARKGLMYCQKIKHFYYPKPDEGDWKQQIKHVDGRSTTVRLTGKRTKGWGDRSSLFLYQLAPQFYPQYHIDGTWTVVVKIYIRVTTTEGIMFEGKEINRRRKVVSKSWWNNHWLARLLGVVQALQTSDGLIVLGEGNRAVVMHTNPLSWECPVGLDVEELSGMPDIGQEIAQFRTIDDEQELDDDTTTSSRRTSDL